MHHTESIQKYIDSLECYVVYLPVCYAGKVTGKGKTLVFCGAKK